MCSFLVLLKSLYQIKDKNKLLKYLKLRGPDATNVLEHKDYVFIHNLLHICGEKILQPFFENNIVALLNGEIYNYDKLDNNQDNKYKSDGECIIPLYQKYGEDFIKKLNGEFAIVIFDFNQKIIILSADIFATKPLFYYYDDTSKFVISSLKSTISQNITTLTEIKKIPANTYIKLNFNNQVLKKNHIYEFNLTQTKNTFDDFINALENAVRKRLYQNNNNNKVFITLSSGYDSGVLSLILKNLEYKFKSYTILSKENKNTIQKRLDFDITYQNNSFITLSKEDFKKNKQFVGNHMDSYQIKYNTFVDDNLMENSWNCKNDPSSSGLNYIYKIASNENYRIYLSGHGADEIFSDYGFNGTAFAPCSKLKGIYPQNLESVFPWANFYDGCMKMFISKEEGIASLHGIEGRYPFLDKDVVQEFIYLSPELKNNTYKAPLAYYMKKYNYPFDENVKIGFKCNKRLIKKTTIT
jgi:asparagine synthetase B (glutamine-hydrolysing)